MEATTIPWERVWAALPLAGQLSASICEYLNKTEHKLPVVLIEQQDGQ